MLGMLSKLLSRGLQLPAEELRGGPAMEDVSHGDEQGARGLVKDRSKGVRESSLVRVKEDGQVRKN